MTANVLSSELTNIIQEAKRKHSDLKNASEKSLQELKALSVTSEAQLAADLQRRPHFIDPLISACKCRNAKLAHYAVNCLQRLIVIRGISKDRIKDILDAFLECSTIGLDVQLKILQALPPVLQSYAADVQGTLVSLALQVCSVLQQTKASAVSSTASATFQQLVSFVFEKVVMEDESSNDGSDATEVVTNKGPFTVRPAAADAYKLFEDLCLLMDGQKPHFVRNAQLSQTFGLELIATLLTDYPDIFRSHPEQMQTLRDMLVPLVTRLLSERPSFPIALRTMRLFCIILRDHLKTLTPDCEIALGLLNHLLEPDGTAPWRRALCMEAFRIIYTTPHLVVELFTRFDEKPSRKNVIQNNLAAFVRLASEKPSLIGISQQSSYPVGPVNSSRDVSQEQAVLEAGGLAGVISSDIGVREVNVSGISSQWSSLKVPCLELIDKSEPPTIPETYSYSLVLTCISSLSEALARTVLPLVVSVDGNSRAKPHPDEVLNQEIKSPTIIDDGNNQQQPDQTGTLKSPSRTRSTSDAPTKQKSQDLHPKLRTITILIDECWPAVLATCSTFLYAALDADYYRSLIRSFQYFTQVAGLLRLSTPRDAFLTTLAKSAVPSNVFKAEILSTPVSATENSQLPFNSKTMSPEPANSPAGGESSERSRRGSLDLSKPSLTPRNLMCMRALVNLAIALGPTLDRSWSIILDTLQKADLVLAASGTAARARDYRSGVQGNDRQENDPLDPSQTTLSTEIAAVETAVTRLFQSTEDYPNEPFIVVLGAFCDLVHGGPGREDPNSVSSPTSPLSLRRGMSSGMSLTINAQPQHYQFAIAKLGELTRINLHRFTQYDPEQSGWDSLIKELLSVAASPNLHAPARAMAVDVLGNAAVGIAAEASSEDHNSRGIIQRRALKSLQNLIEMMYLPDRTTGPLNSTDLDVHRSVLESLRTLLEQCGETLVDGWDIILSIIDSPFLRSDPRIHRDDSNSRSDLGSESLTQMKPVPIKLCRSAFASAQLICSDFLPSLSQTSVLSLTGILSRFCVQLGDLNIALTTITLFWNVSDFVQSRLAVFELPDDGATTPTTSSFAVSLAHSAEEGSTTALWMLLLLRLTNITNDERPDVRNGAIHTVLRILDNRGEQLSPAVWRHGLRDILFKVIELDVERQTQAQSQDDRATGEDSRTLNITTKIILEGFSDLFSEYFDTITQTTNFQASWMTLLEHFKSYTECKSYDVNELVFSALANILAAVDDVKKIGVPAVAIAASLWAENIPVSKISSAKQDTASNERAFVAYAEAIRQIYRLMQAEITAKQIKLILDNLHSCIVASKPTAYASDVDKMTNLQSRVLEVCKILRGDISGVPTMTISLLAEFVTLPYKSDPDLGGNRGLTFIAFAKAASEQLQEMIMTYIGSDEIYQSGAITVATDSLSEAIDRKYTWAAQGSDPAMWKKATSSTIAIFQAAMPAIKNQNLNADKERELWFAIIRIASGLCKADLSSPPTNNTLLSDETFDLSSLARFLDLILTSISSPTIDPRIRSDLVLALFNASLIHTYGQYGDIGIPIHPTTPFKDLHRIRFGRTIEPPFNPRLRMGYFCLDQLFALVASPQLPLAAAAFPHLILRCALPLKMYIADQPLRGRLPTPMSQRLELLHVLQKLRALECEPPVVPEWTPTMLAELGGEEAGLKPQIRVQDERKRHLEWLLPLVNRALRCVNRDEEVLEALRGVMDVAFGSGTN